MNDWIMSVFCGLFLFLSSNLSGGTSPTYIGCPGRKWSCRVLVVVYVWLFPQHQLEVRIFYLDKVVPFCWYRKWNLELQQNICMYNIPVVSEWVDCLQDLFTGELVTLTIGSDPSGDGVLKINWVGYFNSEKSPSFAQHRVRIHPEDLNYERNFYRKESGKVWKK